MCYLTLVTTWDIAHEEGPVLLRCSLGTEQEKHFEEICGYSIE